MNHRPGLPSLQVHLTCLNSFSGDRVRLPGPTQDIWKEVHFHSPRFNPPPLSWKQSPDSKPIRRKQCTNLTIQGDKTKLRFILKPPSDIRLQFLCAKEATRCCGRWGWHTTKHSRHSLHQGSSTVLKGWLNVRFINGIIEGEINYNGEARSEKQAVNEALR